MISWNNKMDQETQEKSSKPVCVWFFFSESVTYRLYEEQLINHSGQGS